MEKKQRSAGCGRKARCLHTRSAPASWAAPAGPCPLRAHCPTSNGLGADKIPGGLSGYFQLLHPYTHSLG